MGDESRICPYCGGPCVLPPDIDMRGRCGCCCVWGPRALQVERLAFLKGEVVLTDEVMEATFSRVDEGVNERDAEACQAELPPEQREGDA